MHKVSNTHGKVFFGIHFYPGVAEYQEPQQDPYRIFLNEETLRKMDPTFAGKPVFVEHVESVDDSLEQVRKDADGWVIRSFYNSADGKHWVEFIIVSDKGLKSIQDGWRLSNAYIPKTSPKSGVWNGVEYSREIISGEFEHLAIVKNPRYEESIILTQEEFKKYNHEQEIELKKLANSKKGEGIMKLNFFKRAKIENEIDLESTMVELPKSKKEMTISALVNEMDKVVNMAGYANEDHMVKLGNEEMSVKDLVKKHMDMCNEMADMKNKKDEGMEEGQDADKENSEESMEEDKKDVGDRGGDKNLENDDKEKEDEKKKNEAKEKAKALKNAGPRFELDLTNKIELPADKLARGRELF